MIYVGEGEEVERASPGVEEEEDELINDQVPVHLIPKPPPPKYRGESFERISFPYTGGAGGSL